MHQMIKTNSFGFNQFKSNVQPVSKGKNHKKEKTQKDKELSTNYIQRNRATDHNELLRTDKSSLRVLRIVSRTGETQKRGQ